MPKDNSLYVWRNIILNRANGVCQHRGEQAPLEAAHIESKYSRPDLTFGPDNGMGLCHECHLAYDREERSANARRQWDRQGREWPPRKCFGCSTVITEPARKFCSYECWRKWRIGKPRGSKRKHPISPCRHCGQPLTSEQASHRQRFCSPECNYAFRKGKAQWLKVS